MAHEIIEIEVDCPECENINRAARRHCKFCDKTGRVLKNLPMETNEQG